MMVVIGDSKARYDAVQKLPKETMYFTFIHPTALIMDELNTEIGEGSFIGANSILTTNIKFLPTSKRSLFSLIKSLLNITIS
jgi:hypothetical protein